MTNGDRIRTLTDQELAFDLGKTYRRWCDDCPALRAAKKKAQEEDYIITYDTFLSYIDPEACAAHMEKWLKADIEEVTIE